MNLLTTHVFIIKISLYVGIFFVSSSLLLFLTILINRIRIILREKREAKFIKKWQPIILENLYKPSESLGRISSRNNISFLILWKNLQDILEGEEKEQLNHLARSLNMEKIALNLLSSRKKSRQLLSILILGSLKEEKAWEKLVRLSEKENIILAMAALQSLAKINPEKSLQHILTFMKNRDGWPHYKMGIILTELGGDVFSKPLASMLLSLPEAKKTQLLRFVQFANSDVALDLSQKLLESETNPEVISEAINLISIFGDSRNQDLIKNYLHHEKAFIRMKAVRALGEIGDAGILPDLENSLSDSAWWVRYRAAQAILKLPGMNDDIIASIHNRQTDRYAKDILDYIQT